MSMAAKKLNPFTHLTDKTLYRRFAGDSIRTQLPRAGHHMASFAHCEVAKKRHQVGGAINQQYAAQTYVVVHKSDDRPGDQPATLYSGEQKSIGVDELFSGSQFLDQSGDSGPEHPKTRRHQSVHEIEFPNFYLSGES